MSAALDHLAARAETDPTFLANPLAEYARSEDLDSAGLAAALGCPAADLTRLWLCGVPRRDQFRADVAAVAARFGIDPDALAAAVRRGQSLARLRAAAATAEPGWLLAARDPDPPGAP
jgi:hypothetical protein